MLDKEVARREGLMTGGASGAYSLVRRSCKEEKQMTGVHAVQISCRANNWGICWTIQLAWLKKKLYPCHHVTYLYPFL